ncbi:hypothetical protein BGZ63DRAFT_418265 [Mariannaea sp. PMI_226]|nr:hypothetical protein BGZ63DRAFT_418265 [Mariannaea sp. PMI_226]
MFGPRRRRPVLGAAVLVGASRAAARHEVQKQEAANSRREMEIQWEVDARRRQEEEQDRRTQLAVEEALKKSAAENQALQQSAPTIMAQPPAQMSNLQPSMMPMQAQEMGLYAPAPNMQPQQFMRAPSPQVPPPYYAESSAQGARSGNEQGLAAASPAARFCTQCGFTCQPDDRFCRQCGARQVSQDRKVDYE